MMRAAMGDDEDDQTKDLERLHENYLGTEDSPIKTYFRYGKANYQITSVVWDPSQLMIVAMCRRLKPEGGLSGAPVAYGLMKDGKSEEDSIAKDVRAYESWLKKRKVAPPKKKSTKKAAGTPEHKRRRRRDAE